MNEVTNNVMSVDRNRLRDDKLVQLQKNSKKRTDSDSDFQSELTQLNAATQILGTQNFPGQLGQVVQPEQIKGDKVIEGDKAQKGKDAFMRENPVLSEKLKNLDTLKQGEVGLKQTDKAEGQSKVDFNPDQSVTAFAGLKPLDKGSVSNLISKASQTPSALMGNHLSKLRGINPRDLGGEAEQGSWVEEFNQTDQLNPGQLESVERGHGQKLLQLSQDQRFPGVQSIESTPGQYLQSGSIIGEAAVIQRLPEANLKGSQKSIDSHLSANLSGGEFLNTLNLVRSGVNTLNKSDSENPQSEGKQEWIGEMGNTRSKGKKLPFGEELQITSKPDQSHFASVQLNALNSSTAKPALEISGQVIPGAMSKSRLATDSLMNISTGIRNLSSQGGGEMRIRLKPGNLGELNVRVITDGSLVSLQIQASDAKAKKVIEESISHLKDSLSAQKLSLNSVDLTVAGSIGSSNNGELSQDFSQSQGHSAFQESLGQNGNQSHQQGQSGQWFGSESDLSFQNGGGKSQFRTPMIEPLRVAADSRQSMIQGRIDVKA